ncbi:transposase [Paenibacillus sp. J2TS4]|uniref:transposase n=1 Tax=Paenibacillus sp. J2TS4 TaxID=2807194 RepID=UPI001B1F3E6F|nr:transposase [Paenibacillus sp. J2TS4]GIP31260.1 hypothetical protein J2TS4_04700 [Paenibacillus sp. J2TS4]
MKILLIAASIAVPILMLALEKKFPHLRRWYSLVALIAAWGFGIITILSIYDILRDGTVFMTHIHRVFLNPVFLGSGAYLGNYGIYQIASLVWNNPSQKGSQRK